MTPGRRLFRANISGSYRQLQAGGLLALASDLNPGTAWCENMQFVIALACRFLHLTPAEALAAAAWGALWPAEMRWKHGFYRFGLEKLMRFDEARLRHHFASFFSLPPQQWYGFLTNTLTPAQVLQAMARAAGPAPITRTSVRGVSLPCPRLPSLWVTSLWVPSPRVVA